MIGEPLSAETSRSFGVQDSLSRRVKNFRSDGQRKDKSCLKSMTTLQGSAGRVQHLPYGFACMVVLTLVLHTRKLQCAREEYEKLNHLNPKP